MDEPVLKAPNPAAVRQELEDLILADLLGPAGGPEEEVAEARVTERYLVGMLAPQRRSVEPGELDTLATDEAEPPDEGEPDALLPPLPSLFPSSLGMTFCVEGSTTSLEVAAAWGHYTRRASEVAPEAGHGGLVWRRRPAGGVVTIPLVEGLLLPAVPDRDQPDVHIRGRARRSGSDWLVTLFLVNAQPEPKQRKDEAWLFQPELQVAAPSHEPVLLRRRLIDDQSATPDAAETRALAMSYRDTVEFAVGHGVGVHVEVDEVDPRRAHRIRTVVAPSYESPRTDAPTPAEMPELADLVLDMAILAQTPDEEFPGVLMPLVEAYEAWITRQERRIGDPAARLDGFEPEAAVALERCRRASQRIRSGIDLLAQDPDAAEAFRFANRAMWQQRVHTLAAEVRRRSSSESLEAALSSVDLADNRTWRPFQLAFILLNLPALSDPTHPERSDTAGLVDLLWFPTGGGKTEAYLGLTAFALAMRRLVAGIGGYESAEGVAVLMRYTLRLLTVQQFQRAAALICACEVIRRESERDGGSRWGSAPFRIGLWVGSQVTPRTTEDADTWLRQQRGAAGFRRGQGGSPAQLASCPWCGATISAARDIRVEKDRGRTLLFCGDPTGTCGFTARHRPGEGLPVVVVDDEIYRLLPALIIGTVDKFAQMPWQGPVQTLFGRVTGRCERHGFRSPDLEDADSHPRRGALPAARTVPAGPLRPPDLIIQDELHLIAGPLGSLVGLYETAVDRLCTWEMPPSADLSPVLEGKAVRPKVIASTATVRRAPNQVHALFLRGVEIFPPPGLDASDTFFARQRNVSDTPGRCYLGICAHGRRFKAALIRVYVASMGAAQYLFERYGGGAVIDPYMTLVGYFNALRELGGMRRLVDDDVATRLGKINQRGLARRPRPKVEELTSRLGSADIPAVLDRLSVPFEPNRPRNGKPPIDVLLATNMVSVGVDIPRLGLMVVGGQPKATAEYIQATSRVGRAAPGLVITVYNWARPRDLSHYETFEHYHATFYRQVEALSVTPFAPRALDRGLTAILAALLRLSETGGSANHMAGRLDRSSPLAKEIVEALRERAVAVTSRPDVGDLVAQTLEGRLDQWAAEAARPGRRLAYKGRRDGVTVGLLKQPGMRPWDEWTCLSSLRDVEPGIRLLLLDGDLGEGQSPPYELDLSAAGAPPEGSTEAPAP